MVYGFGVAAKPASRSARKLTGLAAPGLRPATASTVHDGLPVLSAPPRAQPPGGQSPRGGFIGVSPYHRGKRVLVVESVFTAYQMLPAEGWLKRHEQEFDSTPFDLASH